MALSRKILIGLAAVLLLSLAANLFTGGWWLGRSWHHGPPGHGGGGPGYHRFIGRAPDAARPVLRQAFREREEALRRAFGAVRDARRDVRQALDADPFRRERLDAALAELRARSTDVQVLMHGAIAEAAGSLPSEQRRGLARDMVRMP
ncbi:periplasmic heavy metal sensor [Marinivivus vitaminiproducens]|uniref:periplasmic heavy metal sensor n=1 Tax=Marinivivus vitaminiproducens TaxID=3035935 RepID=UPI00279AE612|nr:periplasmic heavy metal sensor [Geminicoccaceae bacterium SCSIO 64248]